MAEPEGFREFVAARQPALLRTAWLLTGDWHHAQDLVQVALARVWPRWAAVAGRGDPDAYVRKVLVNSYLTWRRRRWHGEQPTGQLPDPAADRDDFASADLRTALARVLPGLPPRQRAVLVLRFYEDLSVEQAAAALGCSPGTIKSQTSKALAALAAQAPVRSLR